MQFLISGATDIDIVRAHHQAQVMIGAIRPMERLIDIPDRQEGTLVIIVIECPPQQIQVHRDVAVVGPLVHQTPIDIVQYMFLQALAVGAPVADTQGDSTRTIIISLAQPPVLDQPIGPAKIHATDPHVEAVLSQAGHVESLPTGSDRLIGHLLPHIQQAGL